MLSKYPFEIMFNHVLRMLVSDVFFSYLTCLGKKIAIKLLSFLVAWPLYIRYIHQSKK